jgi:hypothetical protein
MFTPLALFSFTFGFATAACSMAVKYQQYPVAVFTAFVAFFCLTFITFDGTDGTQRKAMSLNITSMFSRHTMTAEDQKHSDSLRKQCHLLAEQIALFTPPGPNQTLALRHLEDTLMRCNKALCEDKGNLPAQEQDKAQSSASARKWLLQVRRARGLDGGEWEAAARFEGIDYRDALGRHLVVDTTNQRVILDEKTTTSADKIGKAFAPKGNGPTLQDPLQQTIVVAKHKFDELLNRKITEAQLNVFLLQEALYLNPPETMDPILNEHLLKSLADRINAFFRGDKS